MNKIKTAVIFIFVNFLLLTACNKQKLFETANERWLNSKYNNFSIQDFKKYAPANENISYRNVRKKLLNAAVFYELNHQRTRYAIPYLRHAADLEKAAQNHSGTMRNGLSRKKNIKKISFNEIVKVKKFKGCNTRYRRLTIWIKPSGKMTYNQLAERVVAKWARICCRRRVMFASCYRFLGVGSSLKNGKMFVVLNFK